jgi:hypothetical protein
MGTFTLSEAASIWKEAMFELTTDLKYKLFNQASAISFSFNATHRLFPLAV